VQSRSGFLNGTSEQSLIAQESRLCEDVNGLAASIAKEEFNGTGAGVSYLFDRERHSYTQDDPL
jgi:hypothetical protein